MERLGIYIDQDGTVQEVYANDPSLELEILADYTLVNVLGEADDFGSREIKESYVFYRLK